MGYFGLKRNGSGYYDDTAYKAIKHVKNAMPGDIWSNSANTEYLIIKNHGHFCTCLKLNESQNYEDEICVVSRNMMYTHPGMVQYVFNDYIVHYIKTLTEGEFDIVMKAVCEAMGI